MPADLDALLTRRLNHAPMPTAEAVRRPATVLFDAGSQGAWTLHVGHDGIQAQRGRHGSPATTVCGTAEVLADVVAGRVSGTGAFLDGRVVVRGDLALALALDGLFTTEEAPDQFPRASVVEVAGVRTVYLEAGAPDAPPVVLLHGLGATNASMLPTLWDLAEDYRVIAPDLPGHGASSAPHGHYTPRFFSDWLAALQLAVGTGPATVVGNSLGGRIALEAALTHPENVTAIGLLCPSPAFRRMRQFGPLVQLLRPELAVLTVRPTHGMVVGAVRAMFSSPDRLPRSWYDAAADEFRRVVSSPAHRVAFLSSLRQIYLEQAYGEHGFWTRLPSLSVPALFVWGENDRLVPAGFARHVEQAVPRSVSVVIPDCGHVPQFEQRERTHGLLRGFIEG